uniref:HTH_9 domain-containing protein n=1 Tax=Steinernema glaseri TaxID=37863 RepID=A0A1I8AJM1_9BILA
MRDRDFARVLLAHVKGSDRQLPFRRLPEAFNSDSINNSVKLLREKKIIVEGNVVQFDVESGEEAALRLLTTIGDLLVEAS